MKKSWLFAFFVLFFCICALSFNNFAYAQIVQAASNTKNETGFKNQTPVDVLDILQRVSKYSEASQQEIELICNYYGVDGNVFKDLEMKGYDFITSANIVDLNAKYNIDLKTIEEYIKQGKDLDSLYPQNEASSSSSLNSDEPSDIYVKKIAQPEELEKNYEEYVNPQDGSFSFEQEDIFIPGRNGLDIVFAPKYSSTFAIAKYLVYDQYGRRHARYYRSWEEKIGFYGTGWSLGIPHIETVRTYEEGYINKEYLYLSDGQSYEINKENNNYYLKDYNFSDIKLNYIGAGNIKYELLYKDGIKEKFGNSGNLISREDRYGNMISFIYNNDKLCQIIDTMGRILGFSYSDIENGKKVEINVPGRGIMTYIFEYVNEYCDYKLVRKIDFAGRITEFAYNYDGYMMVFANLVKVTHPNGSYTLNTYEAYIGDYTNYDDIIEYFRITSNELIDGNTSYNRLSCTYGTNYYPNVSTMIDDGKAKTKYVYHGYQGQKVVKAQELVYDKNLNLKIQKDFTYYKGELPINITTTKYGANYENRIISSVSYVYNDYKDLCEYTNELGNKTTYTYETQYHRKVSEVNSNFPGERSEWGYDSSGETMTIYYKEYVGLDNPSIETYQVRKNYDTYGNIISEVINNSNYKYYGYNNSKYLSSIKSIVTDRNGVKQTIEEKVNYNPNTGDLMSYADGNGNQTIYSYDNIGRLIRVIHPDNSYASLQYSSDDKSLVMTNENGVRSTITYNALGKIVSITAPKTNIANEYDNYGRKIRSNNGKGNTYYNYDYLDRVINTINPDGTSITNAYDDIQNSKIVTDEEGNKHYYYYDMAGNLVKEIMPNGGNTINKYDTKCQLISTKNANGFLTNYEYNCLGNIIKMTDTGRKIYFYQYDKNNLNNIARVYSLYKLISKKTYDELGRVLSESSMGYSPKQYEYDRNYNIIRENNSNTYYTYDSRNRLLSKNSGSVSYNYSYDRIGNVTSIRDNHGTMTYAYNNDNTLCAAIFPDGKYVIYYYDEFGNRIGMINDLRNQTTYEYDIMNRLVKINTEDGQHISYSYYPDGMLKESTINSTIQASYIYDSNNNLISISSNLVGKNYQYTYDAMGNQLSKADSNGVTTYSYDEYNRIKILNNPDGTSISYVYDEYGNILKEAVSKAGSGIISTTDYIYNSSNRLDHMIKRESLKIDSISVSPKEIDAFPDQQITFTLTGQMNNGTVISDELLNQATWTANPSIMTLNTTQGKIVTGVIPRAAWNAMPSTSNITLRAALQGKVVESKVYKGVINTPVLQNLSITPTSIYANADQQLTFTIAGTMSDGSIASDELLSGAAWTVSSPAMTLNANQGKEVTGIISKTAWDTMLSSDVITIRATLQDKVIEAKVYKNTANILVLQNLSINPTSIYALADQQLTFTIEGTMSDGSIAADQLLNLATWTVNSLKMTLNATQGKEITGVIPKVAWDTMSGEDVITVRATLQDKYVEARVYKNNNVINTLTMTPSNVFSLPDQEFTFTLSGIMNNGSYATYELLSTATWTCDEPYITLDTSPINSEQNGIPSISITGVIPFSQWNNINPGTRIIVKANIGGVIASAKVYKGAVGTPVLTYLSVTPPSAAYNLKGWTGTFTLSGLMTDGTDASDSLLNTAVWRTSDRFMINGDTNIGKTISIMYIGGDGGGPVIAVIKSDAESANPEYVSPQGIPIIGGDLVATIGEISTAVNLYPDNGRVPGDPGGPIGDNPDSLNENDKFITLGENIFTNNIDSEIDNQMNSTTIETITYYK